MEPEFELGATLTHSTVNYQRYTQPRNHTRVASLMRLSLVLNGFCFVHVCVLCIKKYAVYDYLLNEHFFIRDWITRGNVTNVSYLFNYHEYEGTFYNKVGNNENNVLFIP